MIELTPRDNRALSLLVERGRLVGPAAVGRLVCDGSTASTHGLGRVGAQVMRRLCDAGLAQETRYGDQRAWMPTAKARSEGLK